MTLAAGTGYTVVAPASATGTIDDNDTPVITVNTSDGSGAEQGLDPVVFTVTRSGNTAVSTAVTLAWSGLATLTTDYTVAVSGTGVTLSANRLTLTFAAGATTATLTVTPVDDTAIEGSEDVILTVVAGSGYTVGPAGSATGTIADNDTGVSVAVTDGTGAELGLNPLVFTVTRTGVTTGTTNVTLAWSGSATLTTDYTVGVSGATISANRLTLTFAAGQTVATVTLTPVDDTAIEPQETVTLTLAAGTGYTVVAPASATGTIDDNDTPPLPTVSVSSVSVIEGNKNNGPTATVVVSLSSASASTVTVVVSTFNGSATAGSDYTAVTRTLTFAAGVTSQSFAVSISGDTTFEPNETIFVRVTSATGATGVGNQGTVTITNDDLPLMAAAAGPGEVESLTQRQLDAVAAQALTDWAAVRPDARLSEIRLSVAHLDGLLLGVASGEDVMIDVDSAGWGWTISGGKMDLLTVVLHELGHVLGLEHADEGSLMGETLAPGEQYALIARAATSSSDVAAPTALITGAWLLGPVRLGLFQRTVIRPSKPPVLRPARRGRPATRMAPTAHGLSL